MYACRIDNGFEGLPLGVCTCYLTINAVYIDLQCYLSNSRAILKDQVIAIGERQTVFLTYCHGTRPRNHLNTCSGSVRDTINMGFST